MGSQYAGAVCACQLQRSQKEGMSLSIIEQVVVLLGMST